MSYTEWTETSNTYKAYRATAARCRRAFTTPEQIRARITELKTAEHMAVAMWDGKALERARTEREALEALLPSKPKRMATGQQHRIIVRLEKERMMTGDDSGFMSGGPSTREQLDAMTFEKADQYITSLQGAY